jgi:hypothetical protein
MVDLFLGRHLDYDFLAMLAAMGRKKARIDSIIHNSL